MNNFLSFAYWFNSRPEPLSWEGRRILAYICLGLLVVGLALFTGAIRTSKKYHKIISQLTSFMFVNAVIGLLIMFFNYELTPFLRSRLSYIVWIIVAVIWLWQIIKQFRALEHRVKEISSREKEIKQYLP